jgi:hypothetical protein
MSAEAIKKWRKKFKMIIVESFGGLCGICSYNKCNGALELHHLDPNDKDFAFGKLLKNARAWDKILIELRKCVMLCANCHREVHAGITKIPDNINKFNEEYANWPYIEKRIDKCPICGDPKSFYNVTCSYKCAAKKANKIDWPNNLPELLERYSYCEVGRMFGVTDNAVRKRMKNHHR